MKKLSLVQKKVLKEAKQTLDGEYYVVASIATIRKLYELKLITNELNLYHPSGMSILPRLTSLGIEVRNELLNRK